MTSLADTPAARRRPPAAPIDRPVAWGAALALAAFAAVVSEVAGTKHAALVLIGAALGAVLYHAAFGFTGGWRQLIVHGRGAGMRAQCLTIAIAAVPFAAMFAWGSPLGHGVWGSVGPLGVSVAVGGFLFGAGMQLGGGCGSGTLFTVGGGNMRMVLTLAFFILGSLIGTAHMPFWLSLPHAGWMTWTDVTGSALGGLAAPLFGLALVALATVWWERRRHGRLVSSIAAAGEAPGPRLADRMLRGPWPLVWGAVLLAGLNALTLAVAGHPWAITSGFALWGAKIASTVGVDVASWPYWQNRAGSLEASVLNHTISVMNFGLILGAMLAAGLAGKWNPSLRIPFRSLLAAAIGGLMMGYGARLGFGCNIGAMVGGIASGSLHGWLWLATAFVGSMLTIPLRPRWFGLGN